MYWPYLVVIVLLGGFMALSIRNRKRQVVADQERAARIGVGTEVMTTSGLYGTVVAKHDDDTVLLAIAPGVEVKWANAALRDADSLSETYRRAIADGTDAHGTEAHGTEEQEAVQLRKQAEGRPEARDDGPV